MTEKKNGRPTQPGSHSVSYQHRRRKPTPILHRLATKCKRMNWRMALAVILALLLVFVVVLFTFGDNEDPAAAGESRTAAETMTPAPAREQYKAAYGCFWIRNYERFHFVNFFREFLFSFAFQGKLW